MVCSVYPHVPLETLNGVSFVGETTFRFIWEIFDHQHF